MRLNILVLMVVTFITVHVFPQNPPPPPKPITKPTGATRLNSLPPPSNDYSPENWVEFISVEGKFKARFPQTPQKRKLIDAENMELLRHEYRLGNENFILYKIQFENVAELSFFQTKPDSIFETVKNQRLKDYENPVSIISETDTNRADCPAKYIEYDAGKELRYRDLYVLCNENLYQVSIRTFRDKSKETMGAKNAYGEIADAFIRSFIPLKVDEIKGLKETKPKYFGKFRDDEMRFKIDFPNYPEITEEISEDGTSEINFVSSNEDFEFKVSADKLTTTFSFSEILREKFYNNFRKSFVGASGGKLILDKAIDYKGVKGRDLIIEHPDSIRRFYFRILALNGKLYTFSLVDKAEEKKADSNKIAEQKAKEFFDSFEKLFEFQPPKYYGIVYEGVYTSEFYGFSIKIPKGWQIKGGQLIISSTDEKVQDLVFEEPESRLFKPIFLQVFKPDHEKSLNSIFKISGNYFGFENLNMSLVVKEVSKTIVKNSDKIRLINDFKPVVINQKQIWQADFEMDTDDRKNLRFRNYIIQHGKYFLTINAIYLSDEDLISVEESIKSMNFFDN